MLYRGGKEKLLNDTITQYNNKVMGATRIDGDERAAVKFLTLGSQQLRDIIRECYNEFKVAQSPLPTTLLASKFIHAPPDAPKESQWYNRLLPDDAKYQVWLQRLVATFRSRVNAAKREGKKPNLASRAVPFLQIMRQQRTCAAHTHGLNCFMTMRSCQLRDRGSSGSPTKPRCSSCQCCGGPCEQSCCR